MFRYTKKEVKKQKSPFLDVMYRDQYITLKKYKTDLQKLRDANQRYYFSWLMLSQFDNDSSKIDFFNDDHPEKKDQSELAKRERKLSKLYVMLYDVYVMARYDKLFKELE